MSSPVATQQHIAPSRAEPLNDHLRLSLADHGVGFIVPAGARFAGELDSSTASCMGASAASKEA
jgi:hypothetical protein